MVIPHSIFKNLSATITTLNRWVHFAGVRKSGTIYLFVDGRLKAQGPETTNHTTNGIAIGRATDNNYGWAGYIQDFRVYKSAKYTGDFELPDPLDRQDLSGNSNNATNVGNRRKQASRSSMTVLLNLMGQAI